MARTTSVLSQVLVLGTKTYRQETTPILAPGIFTPIPRINQRAVDFSSLPGEEKLTTLHPSLSDASGDSAIFGWCQVQNFHFDIEVFKA
jgi:hypothetical protein